MKDAYKGSLEDVMKQVEKDMDANVSCYFDCSGKFCEECPSKIEGKDPGEFYSVELCGTAKKLDIERRLREWLESKEKKEETRKDAFGKDIKVGYKVWCIASKDDLKKIGISIDETIRELRSGQLVVSRFEERLEGNVEGVFARFSNNYYAILPEYLSIEEPPKDHDGQYIYPGDTVYLRPGDWCGKYPLLGAESVCKLEVGDLKPFHDLDGVIKCYSEKTICYPKPDEVTHEDPKKQCNDCKYFSKDSDLTDESGPCLKKFICGCGDLYYKNVKGKDVACDRFKPSEK